MAVHCESVEVLTNCILLFWRIRTIEGFIVLRLILSATLFTFIHWPKYAKIYVNKKSFLLLNQIRIAKEVVVVLFSHIAEPTKLNLVIYLVKFSRTPNIIFLINQLITVQRICNSKNFLTIRVTVYKNYPMFQVSIILF